MLTLQKCRQILKEAGYERLEELSDDRILELRDFLYQLARFQIEEEGHKGKSQPGSEGFTSE